MIRLLVGICVLLGPFFANSQSFQPGHFTTMDSKEVKAYIKFNPIQSGHMTASGSVPGRVKIKTETDSQPFELSTEEIKGFVAGLDSFVIMKNIPVSETEHFKRDFVKVEVTGRFNLFVHLSQIQSGRFGTKIKKVYILNRKGTKKLTSFHNRYQKDQFIQLIADDPELVEKVQNDWQWMDHLPEVIKKYNSRFIEVNAKK